MADNNTEIRKVVSKLIGALNPRNREVVSRRFGIKSGKRETLESIGQSHGITRERVRQIEDASLKLIRETDQFGELTRPFVSNSKEMIENNGGVLQESDLFEMFSGSDKASSTTASLSLILALDGSLKRVPEDNEYFAFWSTSSQGVSVFKGAVASLVKSLNSRNSIITADDFDSFVTKTATLASIDSKKMDAYMAISKKIGKNVFNEIGLTSWPEIKPRGVRDKSFLVLKREAKPKHFREITELINATNFSKRKAHIQTVHNELIKDNRFVLVGRGVYGLSEWGYKPGTVKDVIASIIKESGPVEKDQLVKLVMKARMVKPNTILLGMQDKSLFEEDDNGNVSLKTQEA